jgi:hypothetical protein
MKKNSFTKSLEEKGLSNHSGSTSVEQASEGGVTHFCFDVRQEKT